MKILHYSLGLSPYRTGGLTKYSEDLMVEQVKNNDEVFLFFPGRLNYKESKIKYYKDYKGIKVYELVNPLPVPLLNGTKEPSEFMKKTNKNIYREFLKEIKVDLIHIHSLMGLHKEFFDVCKELKIKTFFTTHDYYGICTKVSFINQQGNFCDKRDLEKCLTCNSFGSSLKKIAILQSGIYRTAKNLGLIDTIKKLKKENGNKVCEKNNGEINKIDREQYEQLLDYYENIFKSIDFFIYNSRITKEIYNQYLVNNGEVITITHSDILDNRIKKDYKGKNLNLVYLGPNKKYKGIDNLIDIIKDFKKEDITLEIYGAKLESEISNIKFKGYYKYENLKEIFKNADLVIVPSICNETFGFVALEAISYGTPIMVTKQVGSKDLIKDNNPVGIIVKDKEEMKKEILKIYKNKKILKTLNENICTEEFSYSMKKHYEEIDSVYKRELGRFRGKYENSYLNN